MPEIIPFDKCVHCRADESDVLNSAICEKVMVEINAAEDASGIDDFFFYLFEITSDVNNPRRVHRGILVAVHLEEFSSGKILPVEMQDMATVEQILHNLEINRCQPETVTALYSDPCCVLEALGQREKQRPPDLDFTSAAAVNSKLWKVGGQAFFSKVQAMLDRKSLILVQGRNLYEAMLRFRDSMRQKNAECTGKECFNYIVMALSNIDDFNDSYGLEISPVVASCCCELLNDIPLLLGRLGEFFTVGAEPVSTDVEQLETYISTYLHSSSSQSPVLLYGGGDHVYSLELRSREHLQNSEFDEKQLTADSSVVLFKRLILEYILNFTSEHLHNDSVFLPSSSIAQACSKVATAQNCVAFFAIEPTASQIRDIAWDDIQLPQGLVRYHPLVPPELVNFLLCS